MAQTGDHERAITVLQASLHEAPEAAGWPLAQLLATVGRLADAEQVVRGLITRNPKVQPYYGLLAAIRLRGGYRVEAMTALEQGLSTSCCTPGRCGTQPPDPLLVRQLATLYLEDGVETSRGLELADQAAEMFDPPGPEDRHLADLATRARGGVLRTAPS
jgi:hypothetical protein